MTRRAMLDRPSHEYLRNEGSKGVSMTRRRGVAGRTTRTAVLTPMPTPSASNCSAIWMASSRVGDSTSAKNAWGLSSSSCRMGSANAPVAPGPTPPSPRAGLTTASYVKVRTTLNFITHTNSGSRDPAGVHRRYQRQRQRRWLQMGGGGPTVLPLPVCASPMTSLPCRACGMDCVWISDGVFHPSTAAAVASSSHTPSSVNAVMAVAFSDSVSGTTPIPISAAEAAAQAAPGRGDDAHERRLWRRASRSVGTDTIS